MKDVPLLTKKSVGDFKQIQIITGSVEIEKMCVSWEMFKMAFKFSKLAKSLGLSVSKPRKGLAAHSTAYVLRNLKANRHL